MNSSNDPMVIEAYKLVAFSIRMKKAEQFFPEEITLELITKTARGFGYDWSGLRNPAEVITSIKELVNA